MGGGRWASLGACVADRYTGIPSAGCWILIKIVECGEGRGQIRVCRRRAGLIVGRVVSLVSLCPHLEMRATRPSSLSAKLGSAQWARAAPAACEFTATGHQQLGLRPAVAINHESCISDTAQCTIHLVRLQAASITRNQASGRVCEGGRSWSSSCRACAIARLLPLKVSALAVRFSGIQVRRYALSTAVPPRRARPSSQLADAARTAAY